jgi:hypothetical protein
LDQLESLDTRAEVIAESQEKVAPASAFSNEAMKPTNIQAEAGSETVGPSKKSLNDDDIGPSNRALRNSIGFFRLNWGYEQQLAEPLIEAVQSFIHVNYLGESQAGRIPPEHFLESMVLLQSMVSFFENLHTLFFFENFSKSSFCSAATCGHDSSL